MPDRQTVPAVHLPVLKLPVSLHLPQHLPNGKHRRPGFAECAEKGFATLFCWYFFLWYYAVQAGLAFINEREAHSHPRLIPSMYFLNLIILWFQKKTNEQKDLPRISVLSPRMLIWIRSVWMIISPEFFWTLMTKKSFMPKVPTTKCILPASLRLWLQC